MNKFLIIISSSLVFASSNIMDHALPSLSKYGFFKNPIKSQIAVDGIIPYKIASPLFSDYAEKLRFIMIPNSKTISTIDNRLIFPIGTTIIKTFYYPDDFRKINGNRRLLETRLLIKSKNEWIAIVEIITIPPWIVSMLGCSLIINQTHIGPIIVSNKKKRLTSAAEINLGAIVTNTNGIATQRIHIKGTIIRSFPATKKLSMKNKAKIATNNLPTTAAGTKFFDFADRIVTAPTAKPIAVTNPSISP